MRRDAGGKDVALPRGRTHETEFARSEIAKPTVDQARGSTRRRPAKVSCVHERHPEPYPGRVESNPGTDYAAADHEQVEHARAKLFQRAFPKPAHHSGTRSATPRAAQSLTSPAIISKACGGSSG